MKIKKRTAACRQMCDTQTLLSHYFELQQMQAQAVQAIAELEETIAANQTRCSEHEQVAATLHAKARAALADGDEKIARAALTRRQSVLELVRSLQEASAELTAQRESLAESLERHQQHVARYRQFLEEARAGSAL